MPKKSLYFVFIGSLFLCACSDQAFVITETVRPAPSYAPLYPQYPYYEPYYYQYEVITPYVYPYPYPYYHGPHRHYHHH